jgi:hypothetical protein
MKTFVENTTKFIGDIGKLIESNKASLVRGSILDPLNHPSYSEEKVKSLENSKKSYEKSLARLNKKHGF